MSNNGSDISNYFGDLPEIPGYIIEKKIGHGGMADVYKGIQKNLNRVVAIKIINSKFIRDKKFSRRFLFEAQTVAKLSHPNIVIIHDVGNFEDKNFIVMEYLDEKLERIIKRERKLSIKDSLRILKSTAEALSYAHKMGVIHRDIKPDNCMFRADGTPVLVDFGLAKAVDADSSFSQSGMRLGTPSYMSPEQCMGKKIDKRTDIYSLGVMFFKMLTGSVPYDTEEVIGLLYKHIEEPVPELPSGFSDYQELLDGMMKKDREKRIQSADILIKTIEVFEDKIRSDSKISDSNEATEKFIAINDTGINFLKKSESNKKRTLFVFILGISISIVLFYILIIKTNENINNNINRGEIKAAVESKKKLQEQKTEDTKVEDIKPENVIKAKIVNPEFNKYLLLAKEDLKQKKLSNGLKKIRLAKKIDPNNEVILIEKEILKEIEREYKKLLQNVKSLKDKKKYKESLSQLNKLEKLKITAETKKLKSIIKGKIADIKEEQKIKKKKEDDYKESLQQVKKLKDKKKYKESLSKLIEVEKVKTTSETIELRAIIEQKIADIEKEQKRQKRIEKDYKNLLQQVLRLKSIAKYDESLKKLDEVEKLKITAETKKLRSVIKKKIADIAAARKIIKRENDYRILLQKVIRLKNKKNYKEALLKLIDLEKIKTTKETKSIKKDLNKKIAGAGIKKKITLRKMMFIDLTKELQSEYYKKTKRIKLFDIIKDTKISGQISFIFRVDQKGGLAVMEINDKWVNVLPQNKKNKIKLEMIKNISKLKFPPPEDKNGNQIILENWRVTFKILTYFSKVILQRK